MAHENLEARTDHDPFKDLREGLAVVGKKELIRSRISAIKDLVGVVVAHPTAHETSVKDAYSTASPKAVSLPESGVTIMAAALDQGPYAHNPQYVITVIDPTAEDAPTSSRNIDSYDKSLLKDDCSLRDMQTAVEDVVAMRTMQEQLSAGLPSPVDQVPQS